MNKWIIIGGLAVILVILLGSGTVTLPFAIGPNDVVIKGRYVGDEYYTMMVDYSSMLNLKSDSGCTMVSINSDTDFQMTSQLCAKWEGQYSVAQGNCDIAVIATGATISRNILEFRGQPVQATIIGNGLEICLDRSICTQAEIDNDQCTGRVSNRITFQLPASPQCTTNAECKVQLTDCEAVCRNGACDIPTVGTNPPAPCASAVWQDYPVCDYDSSMCNVNMCGDGICGNAESPANCPQDCSMNPPPANPFQFIINWFNAFLSFIRSLFGVS